MCSTSVMILHVWLFSLVEYPLMGRNRMYMHVPGKAALESTGAKSDSHIMFRSILYTPLLALMLVSRDATRSCVVVYTH